MNASFDALIARYRFQADTESQKGQYFERLCRMYLLHDPVQSKEYEEVWLYKDWAEKYDQPRNDPGIDLVARLRGSDELCAVQCKLYKENHHIRRQDLDKFFSWTGTHTFARRLVIDTTLHDWGTNAKKLLETDQLIPTTRLSYHDLAASTLDWNALDRGEPIHPEQKTLHPYQTEAIQAVLDGFKTHDRGKLIMACGTGKTLVSLKIAERMMSSSGFYGGQVLFLTPSLALASQTIKAWALDNDHTIRMRPFAVCSDVTVGRTKGDADDLADLDRHDLPFPSTTSAERLIKDMARGSKSRANLMTVIFATYHSIDVIIQAQANHGLGIFDLVICDEAHRTTGVTAAGDPDSAFVKVHSDDLKARRRLYMTATPRLYKQPAKERARAAEAVVWSMDDEAQFGPALYRFNFAKAVTAGHLADYKVLVLAVNDGTISSELKAFLSTGHKIKLDDASKLAGCYRALANLDGRTDRPLRRAVAFCSTIKNSKSLRDAFPDLAADYLANTVADVTDAADSQGAPLQLETEHVDGRDSAGRRARCLNWLERGGDEESLRVLTNARCLSEGVDVPALDAVIFMHPRKSLVDVVQAVGRVMRKAPGKAMGYIILPVVVRSDMPPDKALQSDKDYDVVWQTLNALRAHDDRLDAEINRISLGGESDRLEVIGIGESGTYEDTDDADLTTRKVATQLSLIPEFAKALMVKVVEKCGTRDYWEDWAKDVGKIAHTHITRLTTILAEPDTPERHAFDGFLAELRDDLNDQVSEDEAIEMLAQHLITRPVFETLFTDYSFMGENPISRALGQVIDNLPGLEIEAETLAGFYDSVAMRAQGITDARARQQLIIQLYDTFFRKAFPRTTQRLGIVYTPIPVVDFILRSVAHVLKKVFHRELGDKGVHIIDPFTGTGTFITRLLQSNLISHYQLAHKFEKEIHANEILLLAYYIAAVNIESVFHDVIIDGQGFSTAYQPFPGICLTDTFALYEKDDLVSKLMADNSDRRKRQKELDIQVIIGNPPYSAGQKSQNDDAQNVAYTGLDQRIRDTYGKGSDATSQNKLYDSYIRALRWGSDRLGDAGILAFVSGSGWLDGDTTRGLRRYLAEEFSSLYILNLRGNVRKNVLNEGPTAEGDNVFGQNSMTGIAISILVKDPAADIGGQIFYHDIGDNLSREDKLNRLQTLESIAGLEEAWQSLTPDTAHDWLNQRDDSLRASPPLGLDPKDKNPLTPPLFDLHSLGVNTARDAWCINPERAAVENNMARLITTYNAERTRLAHITDPAARLKAATHDPSQIKWSSGLENHFKKNHDLDYRPQAIVPTLYRPFSKQWLYFDRTLNERVYQIPRLFPRPDALNRVIVTTGKGSRVGFSALMCDILPNLNMLEAGTQCFPLTVYEAPDKAITKGNHQADILDTAPNSNGGGMRHGVADGALTAFRAQYPAEKIEKDDIFYYVYGLLHSPDYRARFANNLIKELARIPFVASAADFAAYSGAGRTLAYLHTGFETATPYPLTFNQGALDGALDLATLSPDQFRVRKMRFARKKGAGKKDNDITAVIYNEFLTITDIPRRAYEYIISGRSAPAWVMQRQQVRTDKDSGIVSDPNIYAHETMNNPAYPLELFARVLTVSLQTLETIDSLPGLDIDKRGKK
ncbi:MAG: type ISP restriction/modification enzyme [Pseudomonadota bacterium]